MSEEHGNYESTESESRVDKLEKEIDRLKADVQNSTEEIKRTVEDLKKAVVDIRAAVSEIENPFNLLRVITSEKDLERLNRVQPIIERMQAVKEKKVEREKEKETTNLHQPPQIPEKKVEETLKQIKEQAAGVDLEMWSPSFKHCHSLMKWIYMMFDLGFDKESLKRICQYCEFFGVFPKGSTVPISNMIDATANAKSKGLSEDDITLAMYLAAEIFGVNVEFEKIYELVIKILKRNRLRRGVRRDGVLNNDN
ncbi:MAG TPA: hypothetical protein ENG81_05685 [Candidatus Bathyarchaeota archaeon]|nr:hypothetical protein [Candidatus Bathyarchaeota archaeon]